MLRTLFTAIKIAFFIGFLAVLSSLVETGTKILGVPAPAMPTVPAFSFQVEANGGYSAGQGEVGGKLAFDFGGGSQTASQTGKASLNSFTAPQSAQANLSANTAATKLGVNTAPSRVSFNLKGNQLPTR